MDVLTLASGSPGDRGRAYEEHSRAKILEIARIRIELATTCAFGAT